MDVRILSRDDIADLVGPREALECCREAFRKLARGEVEQPGVLALDLKQQRGEVHAKGGYIHGSGYFAVKVVSAFFDNPSRGLPTNSGAVWVFDVTTGLLAAIIHDGGLLTDLRTAAASAIGVDLLARDDVRNVAILGTGGQARFQLAALLLVRHPARLAVWNRTRAHAEAFAEEVRTTYGLDVHVYDTADEAVHGADVGITVTAARVPILSDESIVPGTHISAVGSDMPEKQELPPALLARARVVVDLVSQCATQGEVHHAIAAGVMNVDDIHAELGDVLDGRKPGRQADDEITVADFTGVGVLDAAVASYATEQAIKRGVGRVLDL